MKTAKTLALAHFSSNQQQHTLFGVQIQLHLTWLNSLQDKQIFLN